MSEPVPFDAVLSSLAGSVVSTRMYLERANDAMQTAYAEHSLLRDRPRPSFVIEQITFDVPYAVQGVRETSPKIPEFIDRRPIRFTEVETASLLRGADGESAAALRGVLNSYAVHRRLYEEVSTSSDVMAAAAKIELPDAEWLGPLRKGARKLAVDKLDRTLEELAALRSELAAAKEAAMAGPVQQVMVRLDPEALGQVGAQVNRVQFTMRVDEVSTVDADGTDIDLGGTFS
jgi:hypothetical protein